MKKKSLVCGVSLFLAVPICGMLAEHKYSFIETVQKNEKNTPEKVQLIGLSKSTYTVKDQEPQNSSGCSALLEYFCKHFAHRDQHMAYGCSYFRTQEH